MSRNPIAARRYARAFFELTEKPKEALNELKVFGAVIERDEGIKTFFVSPVIAATEKINVLTEIKDMFPVSILFLEALVAASRIESLSGVVDEFSRMCDEKSGELSVEVESAEKLSDSALDKIRSLLQEKWKKKLKFNTKINASLMGGFIAKAQGKLFDASVATQLETLEEQVFS